MDGNIYQRLSTVLRTRCGVAEEHLQPIATFEELGLDSMDYVTLAIALQKEFGVEIDDEELAPQDTLADSVKLLESKVSV